MQSLKPVLVVEDNAEDFTAMGRAFRKQALPNPVLRCENGDQALEYLQGYGKVQGWPPTLPAIMLLDLNLPGTDGRAVLDAVERLGVEPSFCAGHSLGEYTALTATGALAFDDGVRLVSERADAMHEAGHDNPGTMAAVLGLDDDLVEVACRRADSDVWVANFNAPGQVVIAGSPEGVAAASAIAKEIGAKRVMPLAVGGAFHSPLMAPAQTRLDAALRAAHFHDATVDLVANVDAQVHRTGFADLLSRQLVSPVRWRDSLVTLGAAGVTHYLELGPGTELSGMVKRTVEGAERANVATPEDLDKLTGFLEAVRG